MTTLLTLFWLANTAMAQTTEPIDTTPRVQEDVGQQPDGQSIDQQSTTHQPFHLKLVPQLRFEGGGELKSQTLTAGSLGAGLQFAHTKRLGFEVNVFSTLMERRLMDSRAVRRFYSGTHFSADVMAVINPIVEIGGFAGASLQTFTQQNVIVDGNTTTFISWDRVGQQVIPMAGVRAQLYLFRSSTWGLAWNTRAQLDLVQTELVDDANIAKLSPLTLTTGARLVLGHGKRKIR